MLRATFLSYGVHLLWPRCRYLRSGNLAQDLEGIVHGEELKIADTGEAQDSSSVVSRYFDHEGGVIWLGRGRCWGVSGDVSRSLLTLS